MRRITAVVLAVTSILTIAVPAFADEVSPKEVQQAYVTEEVYADNTLCETGSDLTDSIPSEDPQTIPGEDLEAVSDDDSLISDTYVAVMYLCASGPHLPYVFGHTWICIRNISEETITVGSRNVNPGEMASFGLHHDGGMHYDDEMSDYNGDRVSAIEYRLTRNDLDTAGSEITNTRWRWYEYFAHNCTNFATSVWNRVTGQHFFAFCFPFVVQLQMMFRDIDLVMSSR